MGSVKQIAADAGIPVAATRELVEQTDAKRVTTSLPLLTTSRSRAYHACARLHELEYNQGFRPVVEVEVLKTGRLTHVGLEAWWLAKQSGGMPLTAALAALAGEADPFDRARAEALLVGYDARWASVEMAVLGVELQFETALVNPATGAESRTWRFAGKLDAIAEIDGRIVVVEHKTTSEDITFGSVYWRRLRMDPQVSNYLAGAKAIGHDVREVLYDVIAKPSLRPAKATPLEARKYTEPKDRACKECKKKNPAPEPHFEQVGDVQISCLNGRILTDPGGRLYANQRETDETPDEFRERLLDAIAADPDAFYARGTVVRLEGEADEAAYDLWSTGRAIREDQLAKRAPRNPDACMRWGRTCPFFDVCSGTASLDDPALFRRIDPDHPHEELERGAA